MKSSAPRPLAALPSVRERVLLALYAACALLFTLAAFQSARPYDSRFGLELASAFQAATPFQYRVLVPFLAREIHAVLPISLHGIYVFLTAAFTFGLFVVFRRWLEFFLPTKTLAAFAALGLLYPLFWNYPVLGLYFYPYDIPAIFFFVAGLVCLRQRNWPLFYGVFVLGALNRETIIFLTLACFLLLWRQEKTATLLGHLTAQVVIWAAIKYGLTQAFAGNPGAGISENHLRENLKWLAGGLRGSGEVWKTLLGAFGAIWLLIPLTWRHQPPQLKRLLWVTPVFLLGMLVVGFVNEVRIYNELIPILLTPALVGLSFLFGGDERKENDG